MKHITDLSQYNSLKSSKKRFVIFKHSPTCSISGGACRQVNQVLGDISEDAPLYMVNVIDDRAISQEIASDTGVKHESPQILVIEGNTVVTHASHHAITSDWLSPYVSF